MLSTNGDDTAGRHYELCPEVVSLHRPDGSLRLLHLGGNICAVDASASSLLEIIVRDGEQPAITSLVELHRLGEECARRDVRTFVSQLTKQRLLRVRKREPSWREQAAAQLASATRHASVRLVAPSLVGLREAVVAAVQAGQDADLGAVTTRLLWTARWSIVQFGWFRAVEAWRSCYPQPVAQGPGRREHLTVIDEAVRRAAARSLLGVECKERGLASFAALRASGVPTELVIGVSHDPLEGHVWAEAMGQVVSDDPEHCLPYAEVARFG